MTTAAQIIRVMFTMDGRTETTLSNVRLDRFSVRNKELSDSQKSKLRAIIKRSSHRGLRIKFDGQEYRLSQHGTFHDL